MVALVHATLPSSCTPATGAWPAYPACSGASAHCVVANVSLCWLLPYPQDSHSLYMVLELVQGGEFFTYLQVTHAVECTTWLRLGL